MCADEGVYCTHRLTDHRSLWLYSIHTHTHAHRTTRVRRRKSGGTRCLALLWSLATAPAGIVLHTPTGTRDAGKVGEGDEFLSETGFSGERMVPTDVIGLFWGGGGGCSGCGGGGKELY